MNLQPLLFDETELPSTSSTEDSLARDSVRQAAVEALRTNARHYGSTCPVWLTNWESTTSSWKTSQSCFLDRPNSQALGSAAFSGTWPRSGMTRSGTAFRLAPLTQITSEIASGSLPTPTAQGLKSLNSAGGSNARKKWAKMLPSIMPTITAHDYRGGCKPERSEKMREQSARGLDLPSLLRLLFPESTGLVRPSWAEGRMGYPLEWTACTPLETRSSPRSPR